MTTEQPFDLAQDGSGGEPVESTSSGRDGEFIESVEPHEKSEEPRDEESTIEEPQDEEPATEPEPQSESEPDDKKAQVTPLLRRQVEAILFASEQPVSPRRIALALKEREALIKAAVRDLAAEYDLQNRAFGVIEIAGGFQILTRPEYGELIGKLYEQSRQTRLSQAALETLAIVAYKQPVMRVEVEDIRGVGVQTMLKHLLDMGLLRVAGRSDALGRPLLYGTTRKFLITFGLKSPKDLPSVEDLKTDD